MYAIWKTMLAKTDKKYNIFQKRKSMPRAEFLIDVDDRNDFWNVIIWNFEKKLFFSKTFFSIFSHHVELTNLFFCVFDQKNMFLLVRQKKKVRMIEFEHNHFFWKIWTIWGWHAYFFFEKKWKLKEIWGFQKSHFLRIFRLFSPFSPFVAKNAHFAKFRYPI